MKIIILGAGQLGGSLAETLVLENHDITVVDVQSDRLDEYSDRLDIRTVVGRCTYPNVLRQAGAESADMIIAVTDSDEVNMVACQVAYSLFNIPKKIARIRSQHYFIRKELFGKDNLPIDVFISPEKIITDSIAESLKNLAAQQVCSFGAEALKLVVVKCYYGGLGVGKSLSKLIEEIPKQKAQILAVFNHGKMLPINSDTRIEIGNVVCFAAQTDYVESMMRQFRKPTESCNRVIIAGGGNLGGALATTLKDDYQVKLIDHNRERCEMLAETLTGITILCAEASDEDLLINENIEHTDIFIALTNDDEANILAAIQAKRLGARTLMALINRTAYVNLIEGGAIEHIISPQYATLGSILAHVREGDIVSVTSLLRGTAEALEIIIHGDKDTSSLIGKQMSSITWPSRIKLFGIIREDKTFIPQPDTIIETEDHLLFVVLDKRQIPDLEKLMQVSARFF